MTISFDKENLPSYIYRFNIVLSAFFIGWFVVCIPVCCTVGCIYGENAVTYITMAVIFATFFIGLFIFLVIYLKLKRRLLEERVRELETMFADMPVEEAENILIENGVLTESGFLSDDDDVFGKEIIPFDRAVTAFGFGAVASRIILEIAVGFSDDGRVKAIYKLDGALYNFLIKKNIGVGDNAMFKLLINDKQNFARSVLNYKIKRGIL